jgi:hypothetical protein
VLEAWVAVVVLVALARWVVQVLAVLARAESINLATLQVSLRPLSHRP